MNKEVELLINEVSICIGTMEAVAGIIKSYYPTTAELCEARANALKNAVRAVEDAQAKQEQNI